MGPTFDIDSTVIRELALEFDRNNAAVARLGEVVACLSARFWDQYKRLPTAGAEWTIGVELAWDHLLLATANFKRQRWVDSKAVIEEDARHPDVVPDVITIARGDEPINTLSSGGPDYWTTLSLFRGFGSPPTGSALLAALWPQSHLIVDRRALAVAFMVAPDGERQLRQDHPAEWQTGRYVEPSWLDYEWYRKRAVETAQRDGLALRQLERAFYVADSRSSDATKGSWSKYKYSLRAILPAS